MPLHNSKFISAFENLLFPKCCICCHSVLVTTEEFICVDCQLSLPQTNYHLQPNNLLEQQFYGKVKVERAFAFYHYTKQGKVQRILHTLKYRNKEQLGFLLGRRYGNILSDSQSGFGFDLVVPIPLHSKKLKKRGYNQSKGFAEEIAKHLNIAFSDSAVERTTFNATQTKKGRFERWLNVESIFVVKEPKLIAGRHVLIADDVVTTGATLEACANKLLEAGAAAISIAAIAAA